MRKNKFDYNSRIWGFDSASLSPTNWASLKLRFALESAGKLKKARVLEVGCGGGVFTRGIKNYKPDFDILGVDISRQSLSYARGLKNKVTYKYASAYRLPFKKESFDIVYTFDVLEHLEYPDRAVSEISRVLKKGGIYHQATPLEGNLTNIHGIIAKLIGRSIKEEQIGHINLFKKKDIVNILQENNFKVTDVKYTIHLITQIFDLAYNTYILANNIHKADPSFSVEKYVYKNQGDFSDKILLKLYEAFVATHYWESRFLYRFPGLTASITAVKT